MQLSLLVYHHRLKSVLLSVLGRVYEVGRLLVLPDLFQEHQALCPAPLPIVLWVNGLWERVSPDILSIRQPVLALLEPCGVCT